MRTGQSANRSRKSGQGDRFKGLAGRNEGLSGGRATGLCVPALAARKSAKAAGHLARVLVRNAADLLAVDRQVGAVSALAPARSVDRVREKAEARKGPSAKVDSVGNGPRENLATRAASDAEAGF
jgi:hypothetical protein